MTDYNRNKSSNVVWFDKEKNHIYKEFENG